MDSDLLIKLQAEKAQRFLQEAGMIQLRIKADYNSIADITEAEVLELAPLSHDFVKAVGGLVNITNVEPL